MSGGISRFLFSIPQERKRLKYPPVTKSCQELLIWQTLPIWQYIIATRTLAVLIKLNDASDLSHARMVTLACGQDLDWF